MSFLCYVNGRTDPTQFFYNMVLVFDAAPDLYTLRRSIEFQAAEDGLCCDGSEFAVSHIEILDFRINEWVNLDSRSQMYSGCLLTAIRDTLTSTCAGPVDSGTTKTNPQRVLGFAVRAQRMFEQLDVDGEGLLRLKSLLKVLRRDIDYAVDTFSFLDPDAEGTVSFQQFVTLYHDSKNRRVFEELHERMEHGGAKVGEDDEAAQSGTAAEATAFAPLRVAADDRRAQLETTRLNSDSSTPGGNVSPHDLLTATHHDGLQLPADTAAAAVAVPKASTAAIAAADTPVGSSVGSWRKKVVEDLSLPHSPRSVTPETRSEVAIPSSRHSGGTTPQPPSPTLPTASSPSGTFSSLSPASSARKKAALAPAKKVVSKRPAKRPDED